ncbi:MAG: hypothetical protein ACI9KE_001400 [Polyangiales bacterium]|jgi:hypothetical protein
MPPKSPDPSSPGHSERSRSALASEPSAALFGLLALGLPLCLWAIHHGLGHESDIRFFYDWYLAFRGDSAFYRDGPGINYPIVGVLFVCGPARAFDALFGSGGPVDFETYRCVLKATLVLSEVALIPVVAGLARALGCQRPRTLALLLYVLPSTWATGALFGQIDVVSTTLLIVAAWALVRFRQRGTPQALVLGVLALTAALLTKQLTWFCAPSLGVLALIGLFRRRSPGLWAFALASPVLLFVADPFLDLPAGYVSHLHFILVGGGSAHGDLVVASGASIWSVFYSGGTRSEDVHLLVSSFVWGWIFWALSQALVLWRLRRAHFSNRAFIWWAGMSQLAMYSLMTGVHERYFAHAIPFLFLAHLELRSRRGVALLSLSVVSGVYVVATIVPALQWSVLGRAQPVALFTLAYLLWELNPFAQRQM